MRRKETYIRGYGFLSDVEENVYLIYFKDTDFSSADLKIWFMLIFISIESFNFKS